MTRACLLEASQENNFRCSPLNKQMAYISLNGHRKKKVKGIHLLKKRLFRTNKSNENLNKIISYRIIYSFLKQAFMYLWTFLIICLYLLFYLLLIPTKDKQNLATFSWYTEIYYWKCFRLTLHILYLSTKSHNIEKYESFN